MSAPATVRIPIKPHLKKFVLFVMEVSEPVVVDEMGMLGRAIINVLKEKRAHKFDNLLEGYTARIEVVLSADMLERSPMLHRLIHINNEIDKQFREALLLWIRAQKKLGQPVNESCKNFLATLKIDEKEYSYDGAYKVWQRFNDIEKARRSQGRPRRSIQ